MFKITVRKMGRLGTLKPTVPARSAINPIKMVQTRQNCRQRICSPFYASGVSDFITTASERLILNFFHQSFLSRDTYDRALGRDVINDCADVGVLLKRRSKTFPFFSFPFEFYLDKLLYRWSECYELLALGFMVS